MLDKGTRTRHYILILLDGTYDIALSYLIFFIVSTVVSIVLVCVRALLLLTRRLLYEPAVRVNAARGCYGFASRSPLLGSTARERF